MSLKVPSGGFATKILKRSRVSDFTLTETLYPAHFSLPKHSHERPSFSFVLNGGFTERYGNRIRQCEPSKVSYLPPGEMHSDKFFNVGTRALHFEINLRWAHFDEFTSSMSSSTDSHGGITASLFYKLHQEFRTRPDGATPLAIEGLILEIIASFLRNSTDETTKKARVKALERARDFLHANFAEQNNLAQIAALVGMRPTYLARVFRQRYGCTVGEYLRRLRIEFACRQLSNSEKPLTLIAQDAGFFDQSHFSRTFKLLMGQTPTAYRKLLRHG